MGLDPVGRFAASMDWWGLAGLLVSAAAALLCITFHELSHGWMAYCLGDHTARDAGRLTLNPVRHIDPIGLLMMVTVRVGWAKPVPVDMRRFRHPRRDMALTSLAGPAANFLTALIGLALCALLLRLPLEPAVLIALCFLSNTVILSIGLGLFNLIPIPPLDGSKVLFALLPEKIYRVILRYEHIVMIALIALTFWGVFQGPLSWLLYQVLRLLCGTVGVPAEALLLCQDVSYVARLLGAG